MHEQLSLAYINKHLFKYNKITYIFYDMNFLLQLNEIVMICEICVKVNVHS